MTPVLAKHLAKYIPKRFENICELIINSSISFGKTFQELGYNVNFVIIDDDQNIDTDRIDHDFDCIITALIQEIRDEVIELLHKSNKPFAILLSMQSDNYKKIFDICVKDNVSLIFIDPYLEIITNSYTKVRGIFWILRDFDSGGMVYFEQISERV